MRIPRQIFQTWKTKDLPGPVQETIDRMKAVNPGYEHHLFDDQDMDEFIKTNFDATTYKAYKMLNVGAARADFWRYCIMYKKGGIYLDIDACIYQSLDRLIGEHDRAIISREQNEGIFVQWCMMFEAGHPILKETIAQVIQNVLAKTTTDVFHLTGPGVFTWVINTQLLATRLIAKPYFAKDEDLAVSLDGFCRFYGIDYPGFAMFKSSASYLLYQNNVHWTHEPASATFAKI